MRDWGVEEYIIDNIVTDLIIEKFIDERRFLSHSVEVNLELKNGGK